MAGPGHGFEALGIDLFAAGDAFSEAAFADARESAVDHVEQLAIVVALAEKKFLGVGTGGAVGNVLRCLVIGGASVLLVPDHHLAQFLTPRFQSFSECIELLLVHDECLNLPRSQSPTVQTWLRR